MEIFGYEIGLFYARKAAKAETRASPSYELTNPQLLTVLGYPNGQFNAKIGVDNNVVLEIAPAWAAIRYISEGIANLGRGIFRRDTDGDVFPDYNSPIAQLFNGRVHPHYTTFDFLQTLVTNACLGNGYARIYRDPGTFRPTMLEIIPQDLVSIVYGQDGQLFYWISGIIDDKSVNVVLPETEMIHIKGVTMTGAAGRRVSLVHRNNFAQDIAALQYSNKYFEQGATVGGVVTFPNPITKEQRIAAEAKLRDQHAGAANAGGVMILDAGAKYEAIQNNPKDAAVIDFRSLTTVTVSQIFKVPLHLLSDLTKSTFSNIEQQNQDFVVHCLEPWAGKIEEEFTSKLFTTSEVRTRRRFFAFDFTQYKMGDMQSQAAFFSSMVQNGIMSRNEVRAKFNMNRMEGGDDLTVQINLTPIDLLEKVMTQKTTVPEPTANNTPDDEPEQTTASDDE